MTNAVADQQVAFDTATLSDPELEAAVDLWEDAKNELQDAKDKVKDRYQVVQGILGQRELVEGSYRVGRWILKLSHVAAHYRMRSKVAKT